MHAPATVAAYLSYPCARTDLQIRLAWCLMGIKKADYEASNDSKSKERELELMEALQVLVSRDDSAIAWAMRKDALCFVRFLVDRIPTPVLEECIKTIRRGGVDRERNFLRSLLEQYQDMPMPIPNKELNDLESYSRLEEVRKYSNKELQIRLAWCLMGIKKEEYEASNDSKSKERDLELMEALRVLVSRDNSAIAWAMRKNSRCFVRFLVDRIPTPVLEECIRTIRQGGVDCERNFLRALLEQYQDMSMPIPKKELND